MPIANNLWWQSTVIIASQGGAVAEFGGAEEVSFNGSLALHQIAQFAESGQAVSFDGSVGIGAREEFSGSALTNFDGSIAGMQQIAQFMAARECSFNGSALLGFTTEFTGNGLVSFDGSLTLLAFQWEDSDSPATTIWVDAD